MLLSSRIDSFRDSNLPKWDDASVASSLAGKGDGRSLPALEISCGKPRPGNARLPPPPLGRSRNVSATPPRAAEGLRGRPSRGLGGASGQSGFRAEQRRAGPVSPRVEARAELKRGPAAWGGWRREGPSLPVPEAAWPRPAS